MEKIGNCQKIIRSLATAEGIKLLFTIQYILHMDWSCVCSVVSHSLHPHGLQPASLLCPWDSPGKNTRWVAVSSSRVSSRPQGSNLTLASAPLVGGFFTTAPLAETVLSERTGRSKCMLQL